MLLCSVRKCGMPKKIQLKKSSIEEIISKISNMLEMEIDIEKKSSKIKTKYKNDFIVSDLIKDN